MISIAQNAEKVTVKSDRCFQESVIAKTPQVHYNGIIRSMHCFSPGNMGAGFSDEKSEAEKEDSPNGESLGKEHLCIQES